MKLLDPRYVSIDEVRDFKKSSKENQLIAMALSKHFRSYLKGKIIDVGAGFGDIALSAFPDVPAVLVDRLDYSGYPISDLHSRVTAEFIGWARKTKPKAETIMFCHVMQFLHHNLEGLQEVLDSIDPLQIIMITNDNSGPLGSVVNLALEKFENPNPEYSTYEFIERLGLREEKRINITTELGKESLVNNIMYMLDVHPTLNKSVLEEFLKANGLIDGFSFNQSIRLYTRA